MFSKVLLIVGSYLCAHVAWASETGILKVESNQPDVEILIDGQVSGSISTGALLRELSPGTHRVVGRKKNFSDASLDAIITRNQVSEVFIELVNKSGFQVRRPDLATLQQGFGSLTVITDTPGAVIKLNGTLVQGSVTPLTVDNLGAGEWIIEAVVNGAKVSEKYTIAVGTTTVARLFFSTKNKSDYENEAAQQILVKTAEMAQQEFEKELAKARNRILMQRTDYQSRLGKKKNAQFDRKFIGQMRVGQTAVWQVEPKDGVSGVVVIECTEPMRRDSRGVLLQPEYKILERPRNISAEVSVGIIVLYDERILNENQQNEIELEGLELRYISSLEAVKALLSESRTLVRADPSAFVNVDLDKLKKKLQAVIVDSPR